MANYDCSNQRSSGSSLETSVSTSQALPSSCESMWEGWTQTSPASHSVLTEQLQQVGGCSASTKNVNMYQHDLLSSWLMSGFQTAGQHQQHGEEGSGTISMYQDEFSRMNICSSTSDHHRPAGGSDASQQLHLQTCSSSVPTNNSGRSADADLEAVQFLTSPPSNPGRVDNLQSHCSTDKLDNSNHEMLQQMNAPDLSSRASSSSPPAGMSSYGQMMQHLVGQFDTSTYWTSSSTAITSASPQPSDCSGGLHSTGQQEDPPNSCESVILHRQVHSKNSSDSAGDVVFSNLATDLTDQMYAELHGLLNKSSDAPIHVHSPTNQNLVISSSNSGTYGDHSSWTFAVDPSASAGSSHTGFTTIQDIDQNMLDSIRSTQDGLTTGAKRDDLSPSSVGTAMSTIHNLSTACSVLGQGHVSTYGAADVESSDSLQRKRQTRGPEQNGESGINVEESVKRSCIVRCVWEQNIAQLQLSSNLPSEHQRNLWQLQSQALFGRVPGNFLLGNTSNSGSMDMHTAVGPALNTNGRPRARRGSATDPQSVYARHRRERINDRLKVLQHLVPNGAKVDIVTMLEEAINYVKFLQVQVRLLSSDELWIYAPTTYNGVDVSMGMHAGLLNQQA